MGSPGGSRAKIPLFHIRKLRPIQISQLVTQLGEDSGLPISHLVLLELPPAAMATLQGVLGQR